MYPSTDYPTYEEEFDDFAELRAAVESHPEGLNAVVCWCLSEPDESPEFVVLIFMPRKSATTQFGTKRFDHAEVEAWLGGYVRERVMRWYGWTAEVPNV